MKRLIIQNRRGTKEEWEETNLVPKDGELVVEQQSKYSKIKVGDGVTSYDELPFVTDSVEDSLEVLSNRVDVFTKLGEGSTTGDAELTDIRVGYDTNVYPTAGDAVRAVGRDVQDLRKSLEQFIDADAVDGLAYEDNMLYLTANGQVLPETGVEIVGGGGGGSVSNVKLTFTNLTPNGSNFSVTSSDKVVLQFKFTSVEDGVPTGDFTCVVEVNGSARKTLYLSQDEESTSIDVTDWLAADENKVVITCTDVYGNMRKYTYNIDVIDLIVRSSFNANIVYSNIAYEKGIDFRYAAVGLVDKTVYFELDDKIIGSKVLAAHTSGREESFIIAMNQLSHGTHKFRVFARATIDDNVIDSNVLDYDILVHFQGETLPMIGSTYSVSEVVQGELISIPYIVFDPNDAECEISLDITYDTGTEVKSYSHTTSKVDQTLQHWNTRLYPTANSVYFTITYAPSDLDTPLSVTHTIKVSPAEVVIEPVDDPILHLSAIGRSNNENPTPAVWTYTSSTDVITTSFNNFNWKSNGWIIDDAGDTCLRLNGGAQAIINFAPFASSNFNIQNNGLTIEFEFAIRDVNNRDTIVIDCFKDNKGLQATADKAFIKSTSDTITCNYKDEEKIKLSFTIEKDGKDSFGNDSTKFLSIYMNGVLTGILQYTSNEFNHDAFIKLGDTGCTLDVYSIRIYNKVLSHREITTNYIADLTDMSSKTLLFDDNDIYTANGLLDYEDVKTKIPTITFTGQMPTFKGDKRVVKMDFVNPFDHSKDFSEVYGGPIRVLIDVQGTSSQYYVRKNWKVKLYDKKYVNSGVNNAPYQHMDNEIPAKVFCIKVDYAEGTGTHNTQNANFVETLYSELIPPQKDDDRVRTTITGFPCVIFEKATEVSTPIFSSKGNFNFDKDAEDAFGFNDDYDVECWEFKNNTSDACNFLGEIPRDWADDFEPRYTPHSDTWDEIDELQELKSLATDENGNVDWNKFTPEQYEELLSKRDAIIPEFKALHDWVVSTKDDLNKFREEFEDHFDMHYSLIYYVYTFVALMTDQRAKNMFLTRWTSLNSSGQTVSKWYPYFYDNDTSYGINNEGYLVFDYYHEDTDQVDNTNVYNGQNSILWSNFRRAFANEIKNMYTSLRSDGKLSYDKIINQFIEEGSSRWSASIYNEDAEYKYVTMARPANAVDGKVNTSNLYQVRGNGEPHLKYFVQNRIKYCDSKWNAGTYPNDYVLMRINTPQKSPLLPTEEEISTYELEANQTLNLCVCGDALTDTYLAYTCDDISVQVELSIGDSGYVGYEFVAPTSGTYIFTTDDTHTIVRAERGEGDAELAESLDAVPANPAITVTPYSDMYCGVKYKANGTLLQSRAKKNEAKTFGTSITEQFNDTETTVFGASEISSLGDLSGLYCSVLDVSSADKLVNLQVGNDNPKYRNTMLREINVGTNTLLKRIDLSNCVRLNQALDLSNCSNIEEIYALGTSISGVSLPSAGYIKKLYLPKTINSLTITNHPNLKTNNFQIGDGLETQNLTSLCLANCGDLDVSAIFESCLFEGTPLQRVRLTNVEWLDWSVEELRKLYSPKEGADFTGYGLTGINDNGSPMNELNITGRCVLSENISGEVMAELVAHFPYLTFEMAEGYSVSATITFMDDAGETVLYTENLQSSETTNITCPDPVITGKIAMPTKESTAQYSYAWRGWSIQPAQNRTPQEDALRNILGNRTLYPAFEPVLREYTVNFYTDEHLLYSETVKYGSMVTFNVNNVIDSDLLITEPDGGIVPKKMGVQQPEVFEFIGWQPSPDLSHKMCLIMHSSMLMILTTIKFN